MSTFPTRVFHIAVLGLEQTLSSLSADGSASRENRRQVPCCPNITTGYQMARVAKVAAGVNVLFKRIGWIRFVAGAVGFGLMSLLLLRLYPSVPKTVTMATAFKGTAFQ